MLLLSLSGLTRGLTSLPSILGGVLQVITMFVHGPSVIKIALMLFMIRNIQIDLLLLLN